MNDAERTADITNLLNVQPDVHDSDEMERWRARACVEITYLLEACGIARREIEALDEVLAWARALTSGHDHWNEDEWLYACGQRHLDHLRKAIAKYDA